MIKLNPSNFITFSLNRKLFRVKKEKAKDTGNKELTKQHKSKV